MTACSIGPTTPELPRRDSGRARCGNHERLGLEERETCHARFSLATHRYLSIVKDTFILNMAAGDRKFGQFIQDLLLVAAAVR